MDTPTDPWSLPEATLGDLLAYLLPSLSGVRVPEGRVCEISLTVPVARATNLHEVSADKAGDAADLLICGARHAPTYEALRTIGVTIDRTGIHRVDIR